MFFDNFSTGGDGFIEFVYKINKPYSYFSANYFLTQFLLDTNSNTHPLYLFLYLHGHLSETVLKLSQCNYAKNFEMKPSE